MRKWIMLLVLLSLCAITCTNQSQPQNPYTPDSKPYVFFQNISDSLDITVLNPSTPTELIKTKSFTVTSYDIMPMMYQGFHQYATTLNHIPKSQFKTFIRRLAIEVAEKKIINKAAGKANISVPQDTIDVRMQKLYDSYGSQADFERLISHEGFNLDLIKETQRLNLTVDAFFDEMYLTRVEIDESEMRRIHEEDKLATVRHILLKTQMKTDAEKERIYQQMERILVRARSGEDFASLALQYSEDPGSKTNGGLYKNFPRGYMVQPFEDAAFSVPVGEISDIIETNYGIHILKVEDRVGETRPFEEMRRFYHLQLAKATQPELVEEIIEDLKLEYGYTEVFPESIQ